MQSYEEILDDTKNDEQGSSIIYNLFIGAINILVTSIFAVGYISVILNVSNVFRAREYSAIPIIVHSVVILTMLFISISFFMGLFASFSFYSKVKLAILAIFLYVPCFYFYRKPILEIVKDPVYYLICHMSYALDI